jgi:hypothetical protein
MKTARCSSSVVAPLLAAALLMIVGCTDEYSATPDMSVSKDGEGNVTGVDVGGSVLNAYSGSVVSGGTSVPVNAGSLESPYAQGQLILQQPGEVNSYFSPTIIMDLSGNTLTVGIDYQTTVDGNSVTLGASVNLDLATGATTTNGSITIQF